MIRILIVDDHALIREGLRKVFRREDDIEVVHAAGVCIPPPPSFVTEAAPIWPFQSERRWGRTSPRSMRRGQAIRSTSAPHACGR